MLTVVETRAYTRKSYDSMHNRCSNPSNPRYSYYGARGIGVCERWSKFENFLEDMGLRPSGYTLDRIDSDGQYCPENCRWATAKEQRSNRRVAKNEHVYDGKSLRYWAAELGVSVKVLRKRMWRNGTIYPKRVNRHTYEGKTLREWAEELDISVETARRWLVTEGKIGV